jgi:hypothetical protein
LSTPLKLQNLFEAKLGGMVLGWNSFRIVKYIPVYLILVITAIFERGQMFDTILKEFHPRTIPPSFASKRFCSFRGVDNVNERCKPMSTRLEES